MTWLLHVLGVDDVSGRWYGFWSGFGSDIGEVAIAGGLVSMVRRHNCHVRWCWRVGRHPVEGTPYVVCQRHHPDGAPDHEQVKARHASAKAAYERILNRAPGRRTPAAKGGE